MSILQTYKWTGKLPPFAHQKTTADFLATREKAFCFNEQGTGKTASVIWAADYLMKAGVVDRVLVICPLSIMKSAWQADLFKFAMHRSCGIAHGSAEVRRKVIKAKTDFVVINFDGIGTVYDDILKGGFDLIVVDEANAYKNAQTQRWKVLKELVIKTNPRLWMLTGTPAAQSPLDAYGLARLVNPDNSPRYYGQFRDQCMYKVSMFKWEPKATAKDTVHKVLQPAIRFERDQCIDLPDVTYVEREAPMTAQQQKYYNIIKTQMLMEADGETITAVNAAAKITKLLQIAGGVAYSDNGETIEFDVTNRLKTVVEVIEEAPHKTLIFVPFTHTIDLLKEYLGVQGIKCDVIDGRVSANKRANIIKAFQETDDPEVLLIQPQAAAHGVTLTAADNIIWYGPVTSVETYLQGNARIIRPGQKHPMLITHITGSPVEQRLYKMLMGNIANHEKIIDLYRQEVS